MYFMLNRVISWGPYLLRLRFCFVLIPISYVGNEGDLGQSGIAGCTKMYGMAGRQIVRGILVSTLLVCCKAMLFQLLFELYCDNVWRIRRRHWVARTAWRQIYISTKWTSCRSDGYSEMKPQMYRDKCSPSADRRWQQLPTSPAGCRCHQGPLLLLLTWLLLLASAGGMRSGRVWIHVCLFFLFFPSIRLSLSTGF